MNSKPKYHKDTPSPWDSLVAIVRRLSNRAFKDGRVSGSLVISNDEVLRDFNTCITHKDDTKLIVTSEHDADSVQINDQMDIETLPRIGYGVLCDDFNSLLSAPSALTREPLNFFLLDLDLSSSDTGTNEAEIINRYRLTLRLIRMLNDCAAVMDEARPALVFLDSNRCDIPVKYCKDHLDKIDLEAIKDLLSNMPDDSHAPQRRAIMSETVIELCRSLPEDDRFGYLLQHISDLRKKFIDGYRLFASNFSYERVKSQVEAARIEFSGKIHKAIGDIQNQLLGIPVATVVVATGMKWTESCGSEFTSNSLILLGCCIFVILMNFLLNNQRETLSVISVEIERQRRLIRISCNQMEQSFDETFEELAKRVKTQRKILVVITWIVWIGFGLCLLMFLWYWKAVRLLVQ